MNGRVRNQVIVLAIGNPDRADDGVGALVAARLAGRLPPDVRLALCSGDILSIVEDWTNCAALICVDAASPMGRPGHIHRIDARRDELASASLTSSHAFGLAEAIALARELRILPETVVVYAVEGACFDGGAPMTPQVTFAVDDVVERIIEEVGRLNMSEIELPSHA